MIVDIETKVLLRFHNLATLYVDGRAESVINETVTLPIAVRTGLMHMLTHM